MTRRIVHRGNRSFSKNPHLVIYNPPVGVRRVLKSGRVIGVMSDHVIQLRYRHVDDAKFYEHDFEPGVTMVALQHGIQRNIMLTRPDGAPLWEDFE